MKSTRWRAIIKSAERVCPKLMDDYFYNEHIQLAWPSGGMSSKEEMAVLTTLHSYADSIKRTAKFEMYGHPKDWMQELSNFTD